jgi:phosphoglycolate phosphatase-like HAD superfamily hydrolase
MKRNFMSAILFGSISTLVDSSELQRRAFNEAFESHGLDWQWSQPDYVAMLESNGGAQRIADYATSTPKRCTRRNRRFSRSCWQRLV